MSITYCASELEQKRVKGSDFWVVLVFFFGSFPNNDNLTVVVSLCERRFDGWYGAICGEHEFCVVPSLQYPSAVPQNLSLEYNKSCEVPVSEPPAIRR